jgi:hypothetical protein
VTGGGNARAFDRGHALGAVALDAWRAEA